MRRGASSPLQIRQTKPSRSRICQRSPKLIANALFLSVLCVSSWVSGRRASRTGISDTAARLGGRRSCGYYSRCDHIFVVTVTTSSGAIVVIRYPVTMTSEVGNEVGIRDVKTHLSDLVNRVIYRNETIWVTKNGKRVAALVPVEVAERYAAEEELAALEVNGNEA